MFTRIIIKLWEPLKHWANSLEEEGYYADAKYVMEELMAKIDNDLQIYNERGKQKILELIDESKGVDYRDWETDRKSTRLNSSHSAKSRMPSSA